MSAQKFIDPCFNIFVTLISLKSTAKLELNCKDGEVTVNFFHELGKPEEANPKLDINLPSYSNILKENIKPSQYNRLQRRACARAEEAKNAMK